jgi:DNA-binding transcriptional regulator GbsR (MarR family)
MNLQEIIEKLNNREATRKELAEQLGISDSTLSRRIKSAGYKFDNITKQFYANGDVPNKETFQFSTKEIKQDTNYTENKQVDKPKSKEVVKEVIQPTNSPTKKVTYEIEEHLHDELKIKAIRDKRTVSDIVNEFIKKGLRE